MRTPSDPRCPPRIGLGDLEYVFANPPTEIKSQLTDTELIQFSAISNKISKHDHDKFRSINGDAVQLPTGPTGAIVMRSLKSAPNISIDGELAYDLAIEALGAGRETSARNLANSYEARVETLFVTIGRTTTGNAVLRAVKNQAGRTMDVIPAIQYSPDKAPNAHASAHNDKDAGRRRKGSSTTIVYSPSDWDRPDFDLPGFHEGFSGPGSEADEVLLHEVFHALRAMAGLQVRRNVPFQRGYDTFEEFFAILVANIYRSESKRYGQRVDHHSFKSLDDVRIDNVYVWLDYRLNRSHLRKLRRQMPDLWAELKTVKAEFNPIALL